MSTEGLRELSETKLLLLVKTGNQIAFRQIYHKYWERLYGYAYNILNDKWLAEDVLHEVFTNIWANREKTEIHNLKSYLFNAVRNKALLKIRADKFTKFDDEIVSNLNIDPEIEDQFCQSDLKFVIECAAKGLPARCRTIFYMSKFDDYSTQEIANHFNISQRTVENQVSLALKYLRAELGDSFYLVLLLYFI